MFETVNVPVLGVVENMSGFVCPHCNERTEIFLSGGGQRLAEETGVPLLVQIPLQAHGQPADAGASLAGVNLLHPLPRAVRKTDTAAPQGTQLSW